MKFTTHVYDELGSTNDEAIKCARSAAPEGTTILARSQTAGRGRQARSWKSLAGNLYTSILLRPPVPLARAGELSFVAALAAGETVGHFGAEWKLKWPNDVLVRGRKIAGLLGIGINLAHSPELPDKPTTSLVAEGPLVTPEQAVQVLQDRLAVHYESWLKQGFSVIRAHWLAHAEGVGKPLVARLSNNYEERGLFETLDADGALLLRTTDGQLRRILAGDVFFS